MLSSQPRTRQEPRMPYIQVTPVCPPSLQGYEYLRTATKSDWAWEYLRRNFDYQASARLGHRRGVPRQRLAAGPVLTRLRARHAGAERWGLGCFRRS
jgi:hypothetical protein